MLDVLMLFPTSAEAAAVDDLLAEFVPEISRAEGLSSVRVSSGDVMSRGGPPPFQRVVELSFGSLADWMAWVMAHPIGPDSPVAKLSPLIMYFEVAER